MNIRKIAYNQLKFNALFLILNKMMSYHDLHWPILLLNISMPFEYMALNLVIAEERKAVSH